MPRHDKSKTPPQKQRTPKGETAGKLPSGFHTRQSREDFEAIRDHFGLSLTGTMHKALALARASMERSSPANAPVQGESAHMKQCMCLPCRIGTIGQRMHTTIPRSPVEATKADDPTAALAHQPPAPERMTDADCANAVNLAQQWWTPEHVGVRLAREVVRARRVEQEQRAKISALEASLARAEAAEKLLAEHPLSSTGTTPR